MSVVAIQAEAAPYRVENPPPELEHAFVTIRENAVAALTELRRILGVVRAEDYQAPDAPQPMLADLDNLLANVREAGLEAEKTITGAVRPLPQGVELSAYRIIQEALSNALRHAPGASARVEVSYVLGGLGLRIVNTPPPGSGQAVARRGSRHHRHAGAGDDAERRDDRRAHRRRWLRGHRLHPRTRRRARAGHRGAVMTIRVLVVDDQVMVREGFSVLLNAMPDIEVIGEAVNGREAVSKVAELAPGRGPDGHPYAGAQRHRGDPRDRRRGQRRRRCWS